MFLGMVSLRSQKVTCLIVVCTSVYSIAKESFDCAADFWLLAGTPPAD